MSSQSETTLKVGKKGEIFTSADSQEARQHKRGRQGEARLLLATSSVIEAIPSIEELLRQKPIMRTTTREIERISEEIQKEEGIYYG